MKRLFVALGLASMLTLTAFPQEAQAATCTAADPCVTLVGGDIVVTVLGVQVAKIPAPVKTLTVKVPVPGPVRTIISSSPGPVRTVIVPGPTRTVKVPGPTQTVTVRATPRLAPTPGTTTSPIGQTSSPSATLTAQPTTSPRIITEPGKVVVVTKTKAVGISLGLVALGAIIGLIAAYIVGRITAKRKARQQEIKNLNELKNDILKE